MYLIAGGFFFNFPYFAAFNVHFFFFTHLIPESYLCAVYSVYKLIIFVLFKSDCKLTSIIVIIHNCAYDMLPQNTSEHMTSIER